MVNGAGPGPESQLWTWKSFSPPLGSALPPALVLSPESFYPGLLLRNQPIGLGGLVTATAFTKTPKPKLTGPPSAAPPQQSRERGETSLVRTPARWLAAQAPQALPFLGPQPGRAPLPPPETLALVLFSCDLPGPLPCEANALDTGVSG